jgi:hypothetical protein
MSKTELKKSEPMVVYQGRTVPRNSFRAFVYSADGEYLANSYEEFQVCIASEKWFETKAEALQPKSEKPEKPVRQKRIKKDDADSPGVCA